MPNINRPHKTAPPTTPESIEQTHLFRWAAYMSGKLSGIGYMYHIPNEGKRSAVQGARLKEQGLKPGVPDIHLPEPLNGYHGLWIEMKAGKNKPTEEQADWLEHLSSRNYAVALCYSMEEAVECIEEYYRCPGKLVSTGYIRCREHLYKRKMKQEQSLKRSR